MRESDEVGSGGANIQTVGDSGWVGVRAEESTATTTVARGDNGRGHRRRAGGVAGGWDGERRWRHTVGKVTSGSVQASVLEACAGKIFRLHPQESGFGSAALARRGKVSARTERAPIMLIAASSS